MKKLLALAAILLAMAACANIETAEQAAHATTVMLMMDDGTCSATVIGPHAILTAEHCLAATKTLAIDGKLVEVRKVLLDHADHALVVVNATFKHYATRGLGAYLGEPVFDFGNPGNLRDMYRRGYVSGTQVFEGRKVTLYDINGYYGDSGSGIFDEAGELVGVTSVLYQQTDSGYIKFMGSFDMAFTDAQWAEAST